MNTVDPPDASQPPRRTIRSETLVMLGVIAFCILIVVWAAPSFYQGVATSIASVGKTGDYETIPPVRLDFGQSPTMGGAGAKVGIVIFSDFECPFCKVFANRVLPSLKKQYVDSGKVRLVFKHFPLDSIHPDARRAAALTACLSETDFWRAHDMLFQSLGGLAVITSKSLGTSLGVDQARLEACADKDGQGIVNADMRHAETLDIPGTPTFFIGEIGGRSVNATRRLFGARSLDAFQAALADLLESGN